MKKWVLLIFLTILCFKIHAQILTNTYLDPCDGKTYVVSFPIGSNQIIVVIRNNSKIFTINEFSNGTVDKWVNEIFSKPCPTPQIIQQTITQTVTQTSSQTVANSTSAAVSNSTSVPSNNNNSTSTSESKSETKSESKETKSEEKKEEKKEGKKEEKKKQQNLNPLLMASDLTTGQGNDGRFNIAFSIGVSRSSMAGDESFGVNSIIYANLKQFVLSGGYTKMNFQDGSLNSINSYGVAIAYLEGNYMNMLSYTYIKPHIKYGTYGYNVGIVNLLLKNFNNKFEFNTITSGVGFWTKQYPTSRKVTLSPQIFVMISPLSYNSMLGNTLVNRHAGFLFGMSFDYKISRRFGFSSNYKLNVNTTPNTPLLHNFLIGSRLIL